MVTAGYVRNRRLPPAKGALYCSRSREQVRESVPPSTPLAGDPLRIWFCFSGAPGRAPRASAHTLGCGGLPPHGWLSNRLGYPNA